MDKNLAVGMLAHVDAGKTTLAEAMLFAAGRLRRLGRVDHRDAFLDTDELERRRGITIFAKQAVLPLDGVSITLLDTPGHVDFSAEAERVLPVLDYAVLIVSGADGIQGHTLTLWRLLERYRVPVFLFVNKMDQPGTDAEKLLNMLKRKLSDCVIRFSGRSNDPGLLEDIALCDDAMLSRYLRGHMPCGKDIAALVRQRLLFPCYFGSALKLGGIGEFLEGLSRYTVVPEYPVGFGARVFKISRDAKGERLTHIKVTGGRLAVRDLVLAEKINQIRIYSGEKFTAAEEVAAGTVCAVTGLSATFSGQGLGAEDVAPPPQLAPVLSYRVMLPEGCDAGNALRLFRQLEEEDPQLAVGWTERTSEIRLGLMGEIQLEIIGHIVKERFGLDVGFDMGRVLYKETVAAPSVGIGHFEPLRHYAEAHLLIEPGPRGSGVVLDSACNEDSLAKNWQRLILTHLGEREHPGALTGSPLTDVKITLLAGRAHNKHTEGGDFRQATYRALRQGLMQAESILLEPQYRFELEVPADNVGRAMADIQLLAGEVSPPGSTGENAVLTGTAPVSAMRTYAAEVAAYTRGMGRLSRVPDGYAQCRDQAGIVAGIGYDPLRDTDNPADSIFCSHGSGFTVPWNEVKAYAHVDSGAYAVKAKAAPEQPDQRPIPGGQANQKDIFALEQELQAIYEQTYGAVKRGDILPREKKRQIQPETRYTAVKQPEGPGYLLVDGYNIIHAWEDLRGLARDNMDAARGVLLDVLSNYAAFTEQGIIVVFDAYKIKGGAGSVEKYRNISVVYTKEAETADAYIEKVTLKLGKKHRVSVATSDGAIQMIIFGQGALRFTPQGLRDEVERVSADARAMIQSDKLPGFNPVLRPADKEQHDG